MRLQGASDRGWIVAVVIVALIVVAAIAIYLYVIAPT